MPMLQMQMADLQPSLAKTGYAGWSAGYFGVVDQLHADLLLRAYYGDGDGDGEVVVDDDGGGGVAIDEPFPVAFAAASIAAYDGNGVAGDAAAAACDDNVLGCYPVVDSVLKSNPAQVPVHVYKTEKIPQQRMGSFYNCKHQIGRNFQSYYY